VISTMLVYEVRNESIGEASASIREFVAEIARAEPVSEHTAYQLEHSGQFAHFMSFPDRAAERRHLEAGYTKKFLGKMYPLCVIQPVYNELTITAETRTQVQTLQQKLSKGPTRNEFLKVAGLVATWTAFWQLGSCADEKEADSGGPPGPMANPDCLNAGTIVSIAANHGHAMTVSTADVAAGSPKSYNITGTSGHLHTVSLSSTHFASLAANQQVIVTSSSGNGHTHTVTVSCALSIS